MVFKIPDPSITCKSNFDRKNKLTSRSKDQFLKRLKRKKVRGREAPLMTFFLSQPEKIFSNFSAPLICGEMVLYLKFVYGFQF